MNAYIANGTSIPESEFTCPTNSTGTEYVSVPWSSMYLDDGNDPGIYTGYCGIKGPHPRMATCCQNGQLQPVNFPNASIYLSADDHCSQYCRFSLAKLDLWLYCLTQEGNTVTNAFCRSQNGDYLETSGSLPRDGPFDPDSPLIKDKKTKYSSAGRVFQVSSTLMLVATLASYLYV